MKVKIFLTILVSCCFCIMLNFRLLKADWSFETVDSDGDVGMYNSLAIDSNNNLHISYYDGSNRRDLKYGYYDGTWHIEVVDSNDLTGTDNSIAVDSTNNPHISYRVGGALKYAYHNGVNWEITTIDIGDVMYTSIIIDSNDNPHISYEAIGNLKYAHYNGVTWETETLDNGYRNHVGGFTSIALDSNDNPHISYFRITRYDLKYAYYNGASWETTTIDSYSHTGSHTSIALDSNDNPHISYLGSGGLKYAWCDFDCGNTTNSNWSTEMPDSSVGVGEGTSIVLDSNDNPHISYYDALNGDLKYAYHNNNGWHNQMVDSDGDVGFTTSIALDNNNKLHIIYYDSTNGDLKHASKCIDDSDCDGVLNANDNCPYDYNPDQADWDRDGTGNVCDSSTEQIPTLSEWGIIIFMTIVMGIGALMLCKRREI